MLALAAGAKERAVPGMAYESAVADAMAVAAQRSDLRVMRVAGESMKPFFAEDAVIVVKPIDAARLRVGMIAVYVNRFGEKVAHRVEAPVEGGWQVKGYNNGRADTTVVNGNNLLGVVYATFQAAGRRAEIASAGLPAIETVYAAPAR